ncbi:cystathionine gamma-synthase [Ornithinimicrobium faecis]|uniref:Cystathionine gamma-synthase n=1 Tax=Ornithinimicrobium faecis TaxID=2934158 RepID=A0ABY4YXS6_9MICO|nr:cystathionine gamma-synthase [Ornithinimicrobium sp. HY1793]USQ81581.1 cystathionine gamma-synthase [Ornithinimicrobium sp. HY1793]
MTDISALTRGLRTGIDTDPAQGAIVPPLYLSSNFSFAEFGEKRDYDYTRSGNPTRDLLAEALTTLEGGHAGTITATGMAAITLCVSTLLRPGDTILIPHDCYGGTWRLFDSLAGRGQFDYQCIDYADAEALEAALTGPHPPRVVWLETPSNPLLRITDIAAVTEAAHAVGALVVADNTFLSPVLQRPFEFGVDAVVHSTTKFINGHSDVVGGAVIAATPELHEEFSYWANVLGITGSPFDSYLTLRGLRTLHTRLRAHQENAEVLVDLLVDHPAVEAVHYPGLPDHPGHEIAARQQDGFGAMFSVELRGGEAAVRAFLTGLRCFSLAESLGGTESLIAHPATMTHASMSADARRTAGIRDGLLRVSVGIEHSDDLRADLAAALDRAATATDKPTDKATDTATRRVA